MRYHSVFLLTFAFFPFLCHADLTVRPGDIRVYYKFNETTGAVAADSSGNAHDGTLTNMDDTAWVAGKFMGAISFDGSNDFLDIPAAAFPDAAATEFSIAFWANGGSSLPKQNSVFYTAGRVQSHMPWTDNKVYFDVGPAGNDYDRASPTVAAADYKGKWTHWIFTKDRSAGSMKVFMDGAVISAVTGKTKAWADPTNFKLGSNSGGTQNWHGLIDEFRVYGVALTNTQAANLFNNGEGDINRPIIMVTGETSVRVPLGGNYTEAGATATDVEDGDITEINVTLDYSGVVTRAGDLAAWWRLDEDGSDSSGNGNHGVIIGPAGDDVDKPTFADGKFGKSMVLPHTGGRLKVDSFNGVANSAAMSVTAWVKVADLGTDGQGDGAILAMSNNDILLWVNQDGGSGPEPSALSFNVGTATAANRVNAPEGLWQTDTWQHVAGVMDGATRKVFVDGALVATEANAVATSYSMDGKAVELGASEATTTQWFNGELDDVRVYGVALEDADLARIYGDNGAGDFVADGATEVDTSLMGYWTYTYSATDTEGNVGTATRSVQVYDTAAPIIQLTGDLQHHHEQGTDWVEPGYTIIAGEGGDPIDGAEAVIAGTVDTSVPGVYSVTYDYTDTDGRVGDTVTREVTVSDTLAPTITLHGGEILQHLVGTPFKDPGAISMDIVDGESGVASSLYIPNQILHRGYHGGIVDSKLNFNNNGGLLLDTPRGETFRTATLNFGNDAAFKNAGVNITVDDRYRNLFLGYFFAKKAGNYEFGVHRENDRGAVWLDLDQDGVFEMDGDKGNEWINQHYASGYRWVTLEPGFYRFGAGHQENNGGSTFEVRFRTPPGAGPTARTRVHPGAAAQDGLWLTDDFFTTGQTGTRTITYTITDSSGNTATATRTVEIVASVERPVISLVGRPVVNHPAGTDYTDEGTTLQTAAGEDLDASLVQVQGQVDKDTLGTYLLTYFYFDGNGVGAEQVVRTVNVVDTQAPVITLEGDAEMQLILGQPFVEPGVTITDNFATGLVAGSTEKIPTNNIFFHLDASNLPGINDGSTLLEWPDISGNGRHFIDVRGEPTLVADALNGKPAVRVDGDDFLASPANVDRHYSVFAVGQYEGSDNERLLSSKTRNWILGFHSDRLDRFHPEAWSTLFSDKPASIEPHFYAATSTGSSHVRFWSNGREIVEVQSVNGRMGNFQIGGYQTSTESAAGDVAEVLVYNNYVVTEQERLSIEARLMSKYGFPGYPTHTPPDFSKLGEHEILYFTQDDAGNRTFATRKVTVVPDPAIPVIVLEEDAHLTIEGGSVFTDPGSKITNGAGEEQPGEEATVAGTVDTSILGIHTLTYSYEDAQQTAAVDVVREVLVVDTLAPVITLEGDAVIRVKVGDAYSDPGFSALDQFEGDVAVTVDHDYPVPGYVPGLLGGGMAGNVSTAANPGNMGIDPLGPTAMFTTDATIWKLNWTVVYTGQVYDDDGKVAFLENIDDKARLYVDGQTVLSNDGWNTETKKSLDLGQGGWHDIEVRMSNGAGGGGIVGSIGFGIDPEDDGTFVQAKNSGPNTMDVFRVWADDYTKFDTSTPGSYTIEYRAVDAQGNASMETRNLIVVEDDTIPYIALNGEVEITLEADPGATFTDPKAVVKDTDGLDLVVDLAGEGTVDPTTPGTYQLVYRHTHTDGTVLPPVGRTVLVVDSTPPVLTLAGGEEVKVFVNAPYTDAGATAVDSLDGDITVYSDLVTIPDALVHHVYNYTHNTSLLNFDNNGGLLAREPSGTALLRSGWNNRGINLRNDGEFRNTHPGIRRRDHYQNLFHGNFHALKEGEYEFQTSNVNDAGTIWLDKDQDGVFERFGDLGDERVTWGNQTTAVFLEPGLYKTAIAHSEATGGSGVTARFRAPGGAGPEVLSVIIPANANQAGLWSTIPTHVDTSTPGLYQIFFYAQDASGNATTVARTIVVEEDAERPVITLAGSARLVLEAGFPYSDPGYVLDDYQGNPLDESQVVLTNAPTGMETGTFNIQYNFTDAGGHIADTRTRTVVVQDTTGPNITLRGPDPAKVPTGEAYLDGGATAYDRNDGDVLVVSSTNFISDGLVLHLDAASFAGTLQDGEVVAIDWEDLSGSGHPANNQRGNPTWVEASTHGRPAVNFDGNDMIWTSRNFQNLLANYSIVTVGRYTGGDSERVFSSINRNWLFGFNARKTQAFYPGGWVHNTGVEDTNWHIHAGTMNDSDRAAFWDNGNRLTNNDTGAPTVGYMPRNFQMGGYNASSNMSKCEVSEVLLYDRILSNLEIHALQQHLNSKYNLNGGGDFLFTSVDTSQAGDQEVTYLAEDSSGHRSRTTRKVVVEDGAVIPVIVLAGDAEVTHPAGEPYEDAGATIQDAQNGETPVLTGEVDILQPGTYTLAYDFSDGNGNSANTVLRTVTVVDQSPPVITLVGGETVEHQLGNPFTDPGFSATDLIDGDVQVDSSVLTLDLLRAKGYLLGNTNALDLHNNGGLLAESHVGEATFASSREKLGVYFNDDWDFRVMVPQINRSDNYQFLVEGHFHTSTGGRYEFGIEQPDDRASFWLDLDNDGTFENNGDLGSEVMNPGGVYGYRQVSLEPGFYRFAIAHREGVGGSRIDPRYRAISGDGPSVRSRIYPGTNRQEGQWVLYNPINVLAPGEQTITYTTRDAAGNAATLVRTVIVRNNPEADIINLLGDAEVTVSFGETFTDPGVEIIDLDGQAVIGATPVITGEVNLKRKGRYILQYGYTNSSGIPSRIAQRVVTVADTTAPVIDLNGGTDVTVFQGSPFVDPGATAEDDYDGSLPVGSSENFPTNGLVMHLDASRIVGKADGDTVFIWHDISGAGNDADGVSGTPLYVADSLNGRPGVHFDGFSRLHTTTSYGRDYSIISVSRLHGTVNQRLLSSVNRNWLLGYAGGFEDVFYPENGWATDNVQAATANPHIYSATSGNRAVSFFADGRDKTAFPVRVNNNYRIGQFQMGAYQTGNEPSVGDVNEVILYNRILGDTDRISIEARLNAKYSLNGVSGVTAPVDPNTLGTYQVIYQAVDSAGNLGTSIRNVTVVPDPNSPVITLLGASLIHHEAGAPFDDPGATLADKDGNALDASLISISGTVDVNTPGPYTVTYNYRPEFDAHATEVTRTVIVEDTLPPVITLLGDNVVKIGLGETYLEAGATATDGMHGDLHVTSDLEVLTGQLDRFGYKESSSVDALLNLNNNGGVLALTPVGYALHIHGPGNRGLDYNSQSEFWAGMVDADGNNVAGQGNNFQILFSGVFIAYFDGDYEFGIANQDDRTAIWLDLDRDGTFESTGDSGNEQLRNAGQTGYVTRTLSAGAYKVGIVYREGGGSEWTDVRYSKPNYPVPFTSKTIRPGVAGQMLDWGVAKSAPLDTSVAGTHTITYSTKDASGHTATATRTVIVVEDTSLPFIALNGELEIIHEARTPFTDPKAIVTDSAGQELATDLAAAEGAVDADTPGEYILTYKYTNAADVTRKVTVVDTSAPEITLVAHPDYGGTDTVTFTVGNPWVDPGITIQDADPDAWFVSSRDWIPNKLHHAGFLLAYSDTYLDFEDPDSLLSQTPVATSFFTRGGRDQGFNYDSSADFRREPIGINRDDNYASYISGYFLAKLDGDYIFDSDKPDDDISIWLDLDQDGDFSRGGVLGDERLTFDDQTRTVSLVKGEYYRFIGGHSQGGGGSRGRFRLQTPEGAGPSGGLANIKPTAPEQSGIWYIKGDGVIDPTYPGTHTITYYAMDKLGHLATATRTVIIEEDPNAPVLTLVGDAEIRHQVDTTYEDQLPTIAQANGSPIDDQANITITGQVLHDTPGIYPIQYDYTDDQSRKAVPVNRTVIVGDFIPPVITVTGANPFQLPPGFTYTDPGATAEDGVDGTLAVTTTGANVDTTAEGEFIVTYTATDAAGNTATQTRTVIVRDDPNRPIIHLTDGDTLTHEAGELFTDPGTTVTNARGTTFTEEVIITGDTVDPTTLGTYTLLYNFTSTDGKTAPTVERSVTVIDTTPPDLQLTGGNQIRVAVDSTFTEPGYSVSDNLDDNLTVRIQLETTGLAPVVHWEFDETDGTVAMDRRNGINGTLRNFPDPAAAWVSGKYGNALKFVGTDGSYVSLPGTDLLDLQEFTISLWINTDDFQRNGMLFEKTTDNTVNSQYNLYFDDSDTFYFRVNDGVGGVGEKNFTTSDELQPSQWEHIAVSYDGSVQKIFINNALIAQEQQDVTIPVTPAAGPAYIGAMAPGDAYFFTGLLDDLKIYNVAIDEQKIPEIQQRTGIDTSKVKLDPFRLNYTTTDTSGNRTTVTREVVVSNDANPPTITLTGLATIDLELGQDYVEPGAVAADDEDGVITPRLQIQGNVDTTKAGTYTLTYDVMDLSFNKAEQVVRTVIVTDPSPSNPLDEWRATHLASLSTDDRTLDADPDQDGLANLLEYALNADPNIADSPTKLPTPDTTSGSLSITFLRYKVPADFGISYHVELTTDLQSGSWSEANVTVVPDTNQDGVPTNFEKVTATANTPIASEPAGQQFLRIRIQEE